MATVRVLVETLDGTRVAEMLDGTDLDELIRTSAGAGIEAFEAATDLRAASRRAAGLRMATRENTLLAASRSVGRLPILTRVRLRRVLASDGAVPRVVRSTAPLRH